MHFVYTLDEIDSIAAKIIPLLNATNIVAVNGAMGAGKTTFIHAVCRQMEVIDIMSSPTYSIIEQYKTTKNFLINHIDVYRLKDTEEAIQAGVEDAINSGDFCFIEWPEKIANILPLHFIDIFIEPENHTKRRLVVNI
jgi:tRNA threonylcarbamoyladenosine biosynthesis protein TsaE